jgi:hypothetical protein
MGAVELAESERAPVPGVRSVLQRLRAALEASHRPSELRISWAEYSAEEAELAFHELEVYPVASWGEILAQIDRLRSTTSHQFGYLAAAMFDVGYLAREDVPEAAPRMFSIGGRF